MTDFSFPRWTGRSHEHVNEVSSKETDIASHTPLHKQPACFRVGTPFPLVTSVGVVHVAGANATETGFSLPPVHGQTSAFKNQTVISESCIEKQNPIIADLFKVPPSPTGLEGSMVIPTEMNGCLRNWDMDDKRLSHHSSRLESLIGDRIPCRESLARLSLNDGDKEIKEAPMDEKQQEMMQQPIEATANMATGSPSDDHPSALAAAMAEIEGALGMASVFASLEIGTKEKIEKLKAKLHEERRKRISYQNRYREALARNAELEEQLAKEEPRLTISVDSFGCSPAASMDIPSPQKDDGNKRRLMAGSGSSKKLKA